MECCSTCYPVRHCQLQCNSSTRKVLDQVLPPHFRKKLDNQNKSYTFSVLCTRTKREAIKRQSRPACKDDVRRRAGSRARCENTRPQQKVADLREETDGGKKPVKRRQKGGDKQEMTARQKKKKESVLDSQVMKHEALLISKHEDKWEIKVSVRELEDCLFVTWQLP